MVNSLSARMLKFPKLGSIPLYDFHFTQIKEGAEILEGRGIYADIFNTGMMQPESKDERV